jgi:hypothetical protein
MHMSETVPSKKLNRTQRLREALSAFFVQPNTAETGVSTSEKATGATDLKAYADKPDGFYLEYSGHANLYRNGTVSLEVIFHSDLESTVEKLFIEIGSQRSPVLDWKPFTFNGAYSYSCKFSLTEVLKTVPEAELKATRLIALASGREHPSPAFDISFLIA